MDNNNELEPISQFVDGELTGQDRLGAAERIYKFSETRESWIAFERGKAALEAAPHPMPAKLRDRIAAQHDSPASNSFLDLLQTPRMGWAFAAASLLFAFASHTIPLERTSKSVSLARLLQEHTDATRKSSDIGRAIINAAPYQAAEPFSKTP